MNKSNIEILVVLYKGNCTNAMKSYSIKQILEIIQNKYSRPKLSNDLNSLIIGEYVNKGLKQGHADTFYITDKGINILNQIIN